MAERIRLFGKRSEEAAESIARAEAVLEVLKLSKADLSPAAHLLEQARGALERREYLEAQTLAGRAETVASSLEGRYRGARRALTGVRGIADRSRSLGLDPTEFDAAIGEARRAARLGTVEDGLTIPNYLQAREILETALNRGRDLLKRAESVANEIFMAELALEALKDANGQIDSAEFERSVLADGRTLVDHAKELLSKGKLDEAEAAATRVEEQATRTLLDVQDAVGALRDAERTIGDLRSEGALAVGPSRLLEQGHALLRRAKIAGAKELLTRAEREAQRLAIDFHRAIRSVEEVDASLSSLARTGFVPEEAQRAVKDARRALGDGRYSRAEDFAGEARRALGKRQEVRDRLARTIQETKRKVEALRATGIEYANDVEEMVLRAEREFENGDLVNSSEDLKIATLLMGPPSRRLGPPGKGRPA